MTPFAEPPSGAEIANYFVEEHARNFDGQGCEGISLSRDGRDYCYLWVEAMVDHDLEQFYLLEVRTNREPHGETRDFLYVACGVGFGGKVECEWYNKPIKYFGPSQDEHMNHFYHGMRWFVDRVCGDRERIAEECTP